MGKALMAFVYKCPECHGKFPPVTGEKEATRCYAKQKNGRLGCGYTYAERDENVVYMPAFISDRSKSIDGTARAIMDGGDTRAALAAEMAGCSTADMSMLKIPDPSKPPPLPPANSDVVQAMNMAPQMTGFQPNMGVQFSAGTRAGAHANAGARFAGKIQQSHYSAVQALATSGKRG